MLQNSFLDVSWYSTRSPEPLGTFQIDSQAREYDVLGTFKKSKIEPEPTSYDDLGPSNPKISSADAEGPPLCYARPPAPPAVLRIFGRGAFCVSRGNFGI